MKKIKEDVCNAMTHLVENSSLVPGNIIVLGCSTSEIMGSDIGSASYYEAGEAVIRGALEALSGQKVYLAVGCCEHLNRAVVIEEEAALKYNLEIVSVIPAIKAGGSAAAAAYKLFNKPVMVEFVQGHAGMDIGGALIGMHLKHVAVPVRLPIKKIGEANVIYAKTRPKYVGGSRAIYC